jgi:hypothetical protein
MASPLRLLHASATTGVSGGYLFRCSGSLLSAVIAENKIQNCQQNQFVTGLAALFRCIFSGKHHTNAITGLLD